MLKTKWKLTYCKSRICLLGESVQIRKLVGWSVCLSYFPKRASIYTSMLLSEHIIYFYKFEKVNVKVNKRGWERTFSSMELNCRMLYFYRWTKVSKIDRFDTKGQWNEREISSKNFYWRQKRSNLKSRGVDTKRFSKHTQAISFFFRKLKIISTLQPVPPGDTPALFPLSPAS